MPKMKTLMPDDEDKDPVAKADQPAGAQPVPAVPAPGQDLLQELAQPCEEPLVHTDGTAGTGWVPAGWSAFATGSLPSSSGMSVFILGTR